MSSYSTDVTASVCCYQRISYTTNHFCQSHHCIFVFSVKYIYKRMVEKQLGLNHSFANFDSVATCCDREASEGTWVPVIIYVCCKYPYV